ncbi:hypothetical protein PR048_015620 [Dryococelus australis]|uniref:Integrase zinc-binding domain-containing protein n=1 Tax=Dryococelus australis TaxID=614101 RepID=A0ABQ9HHF7_9NEOP|nr:hypothetical protein PR048_015620 [Dryococelus australis]
MLVVLMAMQTKVLLPYYNLSFAKHQGVRHTYELIKYMFFWEGIYRDVTVCCANCISFSKEKQGYGRPSAYNQQWELIYSKFSISFLQITRSHQKVETIAKAFVTEAVARHGAPKQLLSDRGTNATSQLMKEVGSRLQVNTLLTALTT